MAAHTHHHLPCVRPLLRSPGGGSATSVPDFVRWSIQILVLVAPLLLTPGLQARADSLDAERSAGSEQADSAEAEHGATTAQTESAEAEHGAISEEADLRHTARSAFSAQADSLLVVKSEHRLYVMRDGQPLRSYPIALGLSPVGPKRQEYDFRTPEGRYVIDARRPNSHYFRALHVSYPNAEDRKQALERHVSPGGDIMIHGLPNVLHKPLSYYQSRDWTNGCIALSNDDLLEVWSMVRQRIPLEIRP